MPAPAGRPSGSPQVLPYLYYPEARDGLAFLIEAFGFREIEAFRDSDGNVWHARLSTGDGVVMIGPGMSEFGTRPVEGAELATSRTFVYVDDVDGHCEHARSADAEIVAEPAEQGPNRIYIARDCGGHEWIFATPLGAGPDT